MINVEYRYRDNKNRRFKLDCDMDTAMETVISDLHDGISFVYLEDIENEITMKIERHGKEVEKSFMLNFLKIGEFIK